MNLFKYSRFLLAVSISLLFTSCSPTYVIQAGWEEAGILLRREKIAVLTAAESTDPELRGKLELVTQAREFAKSFGLTPKKSFTYYSAVNRDVLVWVVTAAPQMKLEPYTWWFPIVGRVPYKGYFSKSKALAYAETLDKRGYDVIVRPSAAFSTLGWFNDPVLSTVTRFPAPDLVETVIHEIVHSTVWIKNSVEFNESLANFVGKLGAAQFFRDKDANKSKQLIQAWDREVSLAQLLEETKSDLAQLYQSNLRVEQILAKKSQTLDKLHTGFTELYPSPRGPVWNNASVLAYATYLTQPKHFQDLYQLLDCSLDSFIAEVLDLANEANRGSDDPYLLLKARIDRHAETKAIEIAHPDCLRDFAGPIPDKLQP